MKTNDPSHLALMFHALGKYAGKLRRAVPSRTSGAVTALIFFSVALGQIAPAQGPTWVEQSPGPILFGQTEGIAASGAVLNPVSGAVNAIAISPVDTNTLYAGTVNGGVWKTTNATALFPSWTPLTDQALPGLSINSLAISPLDPNTLFAGTGSTSSKELDGSPGFGVVRSSDGGTTWEVLANSTFARKRINSIVPTKLTSATGDQIVLAATWYQASQTDGGVYRSTDGGTTFTRISVVKGPLFSGSMSEGLPWGGVSSLVVDPTHPNRFYAAVTTAYGSNANAGVYRSEDGGIHWTPAATAYTGTPPDLFMGIIQSLRILLAVGEKTGTVFAMVIQDTFSSHLKIGGKLAGVMQSRDNGNTWTSMGQPSPTIFPNGQGKVHGAIAAHPDDPNVVFISGDQQMGPFPNVNGCKDFSANSFRGDASLLPENAWQNVVCNGNGGGANGTSPHADARTLVFDAAGNLLAGNDGGIYKLNNPNNPASREWVSLNGDIRPTEFVSVAYDPVLNVVFGGAQDVGAAYQSSSGSPTWYTLQHGDGGVVAAESLLSSGGAGVISLRYTCSQNLTNFSWWAFFPNFDRGSSPRIRHEISLNITSGPGEGKTLLDFDKTIQFYNPYVLNAIDTNRMLIGTSYLYESTDRGDSLANLSNVPEGAISSPPEITSLAYGSRQNGAPMPDVFYAGTAAPTILHRAKLGDPITTLDKYPGGGVRRLVMDPQNFRNLYVVDNSNKVWASFDEGATWSDITANLPMLSPDLRCIEIFSPNIMIENTVLIVGGLRGVWQMRNPGSGSSWSPLSTGLPNALFNDLHYNYAPGPDGVIDDVLVAGSLGRGTWTITNYFRQGGAGLPRLAQAPAQQPRSADVFSASRMLTVRPMPPVAVPPAEP